MPGEKGSYPGKSQGLDGFAEALHKGSQQSQPEHCLLQASLYLGWSQSNSKLPTPWFVQVAPPPVTIFSWLWTKLRHSPHAASPAGSAETGSLINDPVHPAPQQLDVLSIDFSTWAIRNLEPQDHVILHIDAAGAEFALLRRMILDNGVFLVDELHVRWHDGPAGVSVGLRSAYEELLQHLNLRVTSLT